MIEAILRVRGWAQNSKHSIRLPTAASPSRGGAGGPAGWPLEAWLLGRPGVERSDWWLTDARVGGPNTGCRDFRGEVWSERVGSRWDVLADGEITQGGTR